MGIQFPPIAFLYLLYLFTVFFLLLFICFLSCTVVKSIIKLKLCLFVLAMSFPFLVALGLFLTQVAAMMDPLPSALSE